MNIYSIITAIIFIFSSLSFAEAFAQKVTGEFPSGLRYMLQIDERPYVVEKGALPDDGSMWGIDGGFPHYVVTTFSLELAGNKVTIPRKMYADVSDVHSASIKEEGDLIKIVIKGGDAAGSYQAEYAVKSGVLIERIVRTTECPSHTEKTVFTECEGE